MYEEVLDLRRLTVTKIRYEQQQQSYNRTCTWRCCLHTCHKGIQVNMAETMRLFVISGFLALVWICGVATRGELMVPRV